MRIHVMWKPRKVEPIPHVHQAGLGLRQAQTQRRENLSDLIAQHLDMATVPVAGYVRSVTDLRIGCG